MRPFPPPRLATTRPQCRQRQIVCVDPSWVEYSANPQKVAKRFRHSEQRQPTVYAGTAVIVGKVEANCRQIARRAKAQLMANLKPPSQPGEQARHLVEQFVSAQLRARWRIAS